MGKKALDSSQGTFWNQHLSYVNLEWTEMLNIKRNLEYVTNKAYRPWVESSQMEYVGSQRGILIELLTLMWICGPERTF